MARFYPQQVSFSRGEFSPDLALRDDTKAFAQAAAGLANCVLNFEGKASRWPGLRHRARHRHMLEAVSTDGATITSPDTGALGTTTPFVVTHVDFGAATRITFVDVPNLTLTAGFAAGLFFIQYSTDDSAWSDFGAAISLDTTARTRRRFSADGDVTARYWRLVRIGGGDLGAAEASHDGMAFWVEGAGLSAARRFRFAASSTELYRAVASDMNLRIFNWPGNEEVANIPIPHTSAQLSDASWTQYFDTGLLFHADVAPWRIFRQGSDAEWDSRAQHFTSVPQYNYGDSPGGVDEVQRLAGIGSDDPTGAIYTLTLEGQTTGSFALDSDGDVTATDIAAALNALDNVPGGVGVVHAGANIFDVTFADASGSRPWEALVMTLVTGSVEYSVTRTTKGVLPGEDVMSDDRGWARCGAFYQSRLYLGGFKGVPDAIIGSVAGEFFDFDDGTDRVDRGFLRRLPGRYSGTIYQLFGGPKLMAFTDGGTFYQPDEPITPDNVAFVTTNSRAVAARVPAAECDDAVLIVSDSGQVLDVKYDLAQSRFLAEPINVLSAHLFDDPVDAASRLPSRANDPNLYVAVNSDGRLAVLSSLRSQDLTGWAPRDTKGSFLAAEDDQTGTLWFVTERTLGGVTERYIESEEDGIYTDCAETVTVEAETGAAGAGQTAFSYSFTSPALDALVGVRVGGRKLSWPSEYAVNRTAKTVTLVTGAAAGDEVRICPLVQSVTGLARFEGADVWIVADDQPESGAKTVSGGAVTLDTPADTSVEIGLIFVPQIDLLPVRVPLGTGTSYQRSIRIVSATIDVADTAYLEIRANDGAWRPVSLRRHGAGLLDVPLNQAGMSGPKRIEGLRGWSRDGQFSIRQTLPSPFAVRGVLLEVVI